MRKREKIHKIGNEQRETGERKEEGETERERERKS